MLTMKSRGHHLESQNPQAARSLCQHFATILGHSNDILNSDTPDSFHVGSGFNRDDHAGAQPQVLFQAQARRFMNLKTKPMPGGVTELFLQLELPKHLASAAVDRSCSDSRLDSAYGGELGFTDSFK